jgi:hypothetical protein
MSETTMTAILSFLPEPSELVVSVLGSYNKSGIIKFSEEVDRELGIKISTWDSLCARIESPTKNKILHLLKNKYGPSSMVFENASFYPKTLSGEPINIKLSEYNIEIVYWNHLDTSIILNLIDKIGAFDDVKIEIKKL